MSVVAVTSRQISKCLAEDNRIRHSKVHNMTRDHWIYTVDVIYTTRHDTTAGA